MIGLQQDDFHTIFLEGSLGEIRQALSQGEDVNRRNENGLAPIHLAVQRPGQDVIPLIDVLVENGAELNAQATGTGETALVLAAKYGEVSRAERVILELMRRGADPELKDRKLRRLYDYAVARQLSLVVNILQGNLTVENALDELRRRKQKKLGVKLIAAVKEGNLQLVKKLARDYDVTNYVDDTDKAAIHYVITDCPQDSLEILNALLDGGAETTIVNAEGLDAWHLADQRQMEHHKNLLESYGYPGLPVQERFFRLVRYAPDITEITQFLNENAVDVNSPNEDGVYAVHAATERHSERLEVLGILLEKGANLDVANPAGQTLYHLAAEINDVEVTYFLLQLGFDSELCDNEGLQPITVAESYGNEKVAATLREAAETKKRARENWNKVKKKGKFCMIL